MACITIAPVRMPYQLRCPSFFSYIMGYTYRCLEILPCRIEVYHNNRELPNDDNDGSRKMSLLKYIRVFQTSSRFFKLARLKKMMSTLGEISLSWILGDRTQVYVLHKTFNREFQSCSEAKEMFQNVQCTWRAVQFWLLSLLLSVLTSHCRRRRCLFVFYCCCFIFPLLFLVSLN